MERAGSVDGARRGRTAKTIVKIAGVVAIGAFFSAFYCWGFWDVMGAIKRVPVGIVNLDEGASVGGKTMNLGADIVEAAQESEDATFVSLDRDAMDGGIEASGYLIVFEIPSDFSERVASGQSGLPSVADLTIFKNERYNFIYSQFASRITGALETSIYQQIAKAYMTGAYEGLFSARDGLSDAAAGMQEVEGGASDLADGLASAAAGAQTASEGASSLASGSAALASGVGSAAGALDAASSGASQLKSASSRLDSGLSSLSSGLSDGSARLTSVQAGLETLSVELGTAGDSAEALASGAAGAKQCYQAAQAALASGGSYGGLSADEWIARGDAALDQVAGGASELAAGLSGASEESERAAQGVGKAVSQLDASVAAIGSADAPGETLAYAAGSIDAGLSTLTAGLAGSRSSMEALEAGAETIASGNSELAGKLPALTSGLNSAQSGSAALADGSAQLQSALSEGAGSIGGNLHAGAEEMGEYVASPTETVTEAYGELDYYGQGFSPFFMTTALWLGSLLIFFVVEPLAPKTEGRGRLKTVLGRLPLYAGICLLEAMAVVAAAYAIGVADAYGPSPLAYGATAFAISFCFMLMMQCLNMVFGLVGKALAVVILILQLACSGGTLPTFLGQGLLATMQPWLPFTYSVDALREVITYCNAGTVLSDLSVLLGMGLVCLACSLLLWPLAEKRRDVEAAEYSAYHVGPSESASMNCGELS
ncbi:MAG: YhgE/Pip domain-containing protein [Coriobacteriia bacterium]|nr:YhgE/Pip domain-containing protein [Coriobacteriia bacterium]